MGSRTFLLAQCGPVWAATSLHDCVPCQHTANLLAILSPNTPVWGKNESDARPTREAVLRRLQLAGTHPHWVGGRDSTWLSWGGRLSSKDQSTRYYPAQLPAVALMALEQAELLASNIKTTTINKHGDFVLLFRILWYNQYYIIHNQNNDFGDNLAGISAKNKKKHCKQKALRLDWYARWVGQQAKKHRFVKTWDLQAWAFHVCVLKHMRMDITKRYGRQRTTTATPRREKHKVKVTMNSFHLNLCLNQTQLLSSEPLMKERYTARCYHPKKHS